MQTHTQCQCSPWLHRNIAQTYLIRSTRCAKPFIAMAQAPAILTHSVKGAQLKQDLRSALQPVKICGLYGLKATELGTIKDLVEQLEAENPLQGPTNHLELLAGKWGVLFSTIKVTGARRVKLALRDMVQISHLTQEIDTGTSIARNRVGFKVPVFRINDGEMLMEASYEVKSPTRVSITLEKASLVPEKLQSLFDANFDLLLSIFNPEGYLDITYCDQDLRVGRDDKGHIFVLERL